jgi:hypothetical protein
MKKPTVKKEKWIVREDRRNERTRLITETYYCPVCDIESGHEYYDEFKNGETDISNFIDDYDDIGQINLSLRIVFADNDENGIKLAIGDMEEIELYGKENDKYGLKKKYDKLCYTTKFHDCSSIGPSFCSERCLLKWIKENLEV